MDFYLEIKGEGEIYYTLDGSVPTKQSIRYTEPIHIKDASNNPNSNSMNKNVSKFFYFPPDTPDDDIVRKYKVPKYLIDKCNIVRAVSFLKNGGKTPVISASYFVNFKDKVEYQDIGIISLVTDPKNLFDEKRGIYVLGNKTGYINFRAKGQSSEREAYIEVFNKNRDLILQKNIGIRIHGGYTRWKNPKSLNFYFRDRYDKTDNFYGNIIDVKYNPKELTLLYPSTDSTRIKDFLVMSLYNNKNVATMKFKPYLLFINGEYWGFYYLTEKYNADFISYYYKIKNENNIIILKSFDKIFVEFENIIGYINKNHFWEGEVYYNTLSNMVDIDSFVEYIAILIYTGRRQNFFKFNCGVWKSMKKTNNKYQNGKWYFMLYDMDCICCEEFDFYTIDKIIDLMEDGRFKEKFYDELIRLSKEDFNPIVIEDFIKSNGSYIKKYVLNDYKRFYGIDKKNGEIIFKENIEKILEFFKNRPKSVFEYFEDDSL